MAELHEAILKEVQLGHLHGPYTEQEVSQFFGSEKWLFNPKFVLYQSAENKALTIDDGKRSWLNLAYAANFKLELFDC